MNTQLYPADNYYKTLRRLENNLQSGKFASYSQQKKQQIWHRLCRYARQLGISIKSSVVAACIAAGLCAAPSHSSAQITFVQETGANNPFNGIDLGYFSAPAFVDIDNDGDFDAFVSDDNGIIHYYKNTGNAATPAFVEQTGGSNPLSSVSLGGGESHLFFEIGRAHV